MLLHVGYPKAASTWLQACVFTKDLDFKTPWPTAENEALERFALRADGSFDAEAVRRDFDRVGDQQTGEAVLSHEVLVGDPIRGQYWGFQVAERLARTFPDARVLISVRSQPGYVYSAWGEYVRRGGFLNLLDYLGCDDVPPGYRPFCPPSFLAFDELCQQYRNLFGERSVFVLPTEAIARSGQEVLSRLGAFLDRDLSQVSLARVYPSFKAGTFAYLRWTNQHFFPYDPTQRRSRRTPMKWARLIDRMLPRALHEGLRHRQGQLVEQLLGERYRDSNRRLQDLTPFDLTKLGYQL